MLQFISEAHSRVLVLYGRRGIGKTSLLLRWVLPRLGEGRGFYLDLRAALPGKADGSDQLDGLESAIAAGAVVFLDSAERLLDADAATRDAFLRCALSPPKETGPQSPLVLVVNEDRLRDVFALRAQIPEILDHTFEITGVDLREGLTALLLDGTAAARGGKPVAAGSSLLGREVSKDLGALAAKSGGVSPELLRIVDSRLRRSPQAAVATVAAAAGQQSDSPGPGLEAVLWDYVSERLDALSNRALPAKTRFDLGLAIVEEVAATGKSDAPMELQAIALRIGVGTDDCREVLTELLGPSGLIRDRDAGRYALVPPELAEVVIAECNRRQAYARESEHLVDQAVAAWRADNALLPRREFREVQRHRRSLQLQPEELEVLVRSSLLHDDEAGLPAAHYWVQRLANRTAAADILSSSLFHGSETVRAHAAVLLGEFPDPAVRDQLHALALRDPDAAVRRCAAASLARMKTEELRQLLFAEVGAESSPYRETALETLRIFDDPVTVAGIRSLLARGGLAPELRRTAFQVVSQLEIPESADLLLEVALSAADAADQEVAAQGLLAIDSEALQAHVLGTLRAPRPARESASRPGTGAAWARAAGFTVRLLLALAITLMNGVVHGFVLVLRRRYRYGLALLAAELVGVAWCFNSGTVLLGIGILVSTWMLSELGGLRVVVDGRRAGRPADGVLATLLCLSCLVNPVCWCFHGLVHGAVRRWRRGALLLVLGAAGILLSASMAPFLSPLLASTSTPWDHLLAYTARGYFFLGVLLFVGTYAYDVFGVLATEIAFAGALDLRRRRHAIFRLLVKNPAAARCVLRDQAGADRTAARWARWILRRFGSSIRPEVLLDQIGCPPRTAPALIVRSLARSKTEATIRELTAAWPAADRQARETMVTLLATEPSEASIEALAALRQEMSWRARCRYWLGAWRFRFGVWPRLALCCMLLALPVVGVLGSEGYHALHEPSTPQLRLVESNEDELRRVRTADFLASVYSEESEPRLAALFRNEKVPHGVRAGLAKSLSLMILRGVSRAAREGARTELIQASLPGQAPWLRKAALTSIASTLRDRSDAATSEALRPVLFAIVVDARDDMALRRLALAGLASMETAEASAALGKIVATGSPLLPPPTGRDPGEIQRREEDLRLEAVAALSRMGTPEAVGQLRQLAAAPLLPASLKAAARLAAADPLRRVRNDLEQDKAEHAVKLAEGFLAEKFEGLAPAAEVYALLGKAHYQIASGALAGEGDWPPAADNLRRAREAGSRDPDLPRLLALVEDHLNTR